MCTCVPAKKTAKRSQHNTMCPRAECQTCTLFGHVAKDCAYQLFGRRHRLVEPFVRKMRKHRGRVLNRSLRQSLCEPMASSASWDQLQHHKSTLSANQLMEIKLATCSVKPDETRKYDRIVRHLNNPTDSPIHVVYVYNCLE
jgi:hypothetical protein